MTLRLIVFDVDGTLIDSQREICAAMRAAYDDLGVAPPPDEAILSIVGLSLPQAIQRLAPELSQPRQGALAAGYRAHFARARRAGALPPLYPGARALLDALAAQDATLLGIATGKSRRGLAELLEMHGLGGRFLTAQVADDHPSKPHPAMLNAALAETGIEADAATMIGDTEFDMEMACGAGLRALGVGWGYHDTARLRAAGAERVLPDMGALAAVLNEGRA